jgi:DNA-binding XRE family transcriptional regulator
MTLAPDGIPRQVFATLVAKRRKTPGRPRLATNSFGKWIDREGLTREHVAEKLGITKSALNYVANGQRLPGLKLAFDIERLTKGEITARSWLKAPTPPARTKSSSRKKSKR